MFGYVKYDRLLSCFETQGPMRVQCLALSKFHIGGGEVFFMME